MKSLTKVIIIMIMILLVGFTFITSESNKAFEPANITINRTVNNDINSEKTSIVNYVNKGNMTASWYGPRFHGKLTANGEIFDESALTAASKTLKFGTLLKITNPRNLKTVVVRINDRGPYIAGRQLDLSRGAANALGMVKRGVIKVNVEQISLKGVNSPVISLN